MVLVFGIRVAFFIASVHYIRILVFLVFFAIINSYDCVCMTYTASFFFSMVGISPVTLAVNSAISLVRKRI